MTLERGNPPRLNKKQYHQLLTKNRNCSLKKPALIGAGKNKAIFLPENLGIKSEKGSIEPFMTPYLS